MATKEYGTMTGDKLREIRKALGLNQTQFAAKLFVSKPTMSNIENNKTPITKTMQLAIECICYQELYIPPDKCIESLLIKMGAK